MDGQMDGQTDSRMDGQTDGRTDRRTNGRKISPFYRTLSPIGPAALPPPMKTIEKVKKGKGTADHLMPLGNLFTVLTFIQRMDGQTDRRMGVFTKGHTDCQKTLAISKALRGSKSEFWDICKII